VTDEEQREFSEQQVQQRFDAIGKDLVEAGLYAEAVEAYKDLMRSYPTSRWAANAYMAIAHCYHAMGQEEDELAALEDIIAQFPDHVVTKRARGAIAALRERRSGEGPAGSDLHAAVRRLTRQVDRMREGERRRTWVGIVAYVALIIAVWFAVKSSSRSPSRAAQDLSKRVTALESAVQALSSGAPASPNAGAKASGPSVTVIPVTPPPTPAGKATPTPEAKAPPKPTAPVSGKAAPTGPTRPAKAPVPAAKPTPTAKAVPTPTPPAAARSYTIKAGDSLWTVARTELGDARKVDEIARLNGLKPPYKLRVGDKINLPARE
jgi:LysM repeat protein